MTSERIKEIQQQTAYPHSVSVQQALLQVWNECSQLPQQDTEKEMFELEQQLDIPSHMRWHNRTSSQTTSDKWKEYQDWLNELPEISDEEIEKEGWKYFYENKISLKNIVLWINACKWYREQLKHKG